LRSSQKFRALEKILVLRYTFNAIVDFKPVMKTDKTQTKTDRQIETDGLSVCPCHCVSYRQTDRQTADNAVGALADYAA